MAIRITNIRRSEKRFRLEPRTTTGQKISKSAEITVKSSESLSAVTVGMVDSLPAITADKPMENTNEMKQRIWMGGRARWWKRLIRNMTTKRVLTREEIIALQEKQRRDELEKLLRLEANLYKGRIINRLTGLGMAYKYKTNERDIWASKFQVVKFDLCVLQPDAIYFKISTDTLPYGVSIMQLMDEGVLTDLSLSCGSRVMADYSETRGAWYIIERASGAMGIPNHVKFADMLERYPASADGLSIPFGITTNGRPVYKSLDNNMPHMLIGGTTGAGKSNFVNVLLCALIRRNTPKHLRIVMVDLKGGLEFDFYEGIPHLLPIDGVADNGIANFRDQVPGVLDYVLKEGEKRIKKLKAAGKKDIGRYNQFHRKDPLPHLIFIIDEYADVKLDRKIGKDVEEKLINIASRFRAVGIHVIICTQVPKSTVIDTRIKGVLPGRVAFSCTGNHESMAILDNGHANGLAPVGRAILKSAGEITFQAPYINDQTVKQIVAGAISGTYSDAKIEEHDVTLEEVLAWSLDNDTGYLSVRRLYGHFKDRGLKRIEIEKWMSDIENTEILVNSTVYRVEPAGGSRARRLVAADRGDDEK